MGILLSVPSEADHERALKVMDALLGDAGDGMHAFTLSVSGVGGDVVMEWVINQNAGCVIGSVDQGIEFADLLAIALTGRHHSGMVRRTVRAHTESVRGWVFLSGGKARPLDSDEIRAAYSRDARTGETFPLDPHLNFVKAADIIC